MGHFLVGTRFIASSLSRRFTEAGRDESRPYKMTCLLKTKRPSIWKGACIGVKPGKSGKDLEDAVAPVGDLIAVARDVLGGEPEVAGRVYLTVGIVAPASNAAEGGSVGEAVIRGGSGSSQMHSGELLRGSALGGIGGAQEGAGATESEDHRHRAALVLIDVRVEQVVALRGDVALLQDRRTRADNVSGQLRRHLAGVAEAGRKHCQPEYVDPGAGLRLLAGQLPALPAHQ